MLWRLRQNLSRRLGLSDTQWARVVMDRELEAAIKALDVSKLSALEISGTKWSKAGFGKYKSVSYPEYDVCAGVYQEQAYDVVIAEQVLEHVAWPYRAVKNIYSMLRRGGVFVVSTPFLIRMHREPLDCCRWSEQGMKHLLAEGGFDLQKIRTGAWGNRKCVVANFRRWQRWIAWWHSLTNEPDFPVVVWALATK